MWSPTLMAEALERTKPFDSETRGSTFLEVRARSTSPWFGVAVALAVLSLVACQPRQPPTMTTWLPAWEAAKKAMPARTSFDGSQDREICGHALGELRRARERILPAPDDNLDRLADAWLHLAEAMMFECPENWGEHTGFDDGYRELTRLALEVDLALRTSSQNAQPPGPEDGDQLQ